MILVNLLAILVRILANLLVKPAELGLRGPSGLRVRGIHSGEARTQPEEPWALGQPPAVATGCRKWASPLLPLLRLMMRLTRLTRVLLELPGILLGISPDLLGFYWNITRISTREFTRNLLVTGVDRLLPIFRTFLGGYSHITNYFTWCYYNMHVFFFRGSSNRGITRFR